MPATIYEPADFGEVLRRRRKALKLTQVQAARLAGVSPRLWNECERGKRPQVSFETALRMLQTVGADLSVSERGRSAASGQ